LKKKKNFLGGVFCFGAGKKPGVFFSVFGEFGKERHLSASRGGGRLGKQKKKKKNPGRGLNFQGLAGEKGGAGPEVFEKKNGIKQNKGVVCRGVPGKPKKKKNFTKTGGRDNTKCVGGGGGGGGGNFFFFSPPFPWFFFFFFFLCFFFFFFFCSFCVPFSFPSVFWLLGFEGKGKNFHLGFLGFRSQVGNCCFGEKPGKNTV